MKTLSFVFALSISSAALAGELQISHLSQGPAAPVLCNAAILSKSADASANTLSATVSTWNSTTASYAGNVTKSVAANGTDAFARMLSNADALGTKLSNFKISLGSKDFVSGIRLDYCYRGPAENYYSTKPEAEVQMNFELDSKVVVNALDGAAGVTDYVKNAKLEISHAIICDRQGEGKYKFAHDGDENGGTFNTLKSDLEFAAMDAGQRGKNDFMTSMGRSPFLVVDNVSTAPFPRTLTKESSHGVRFCVFRYEFYETSGAARNNVAMPRISIKNDVTITKVSDEE